MESKGKFMSLGSQIMLKLMHSYSTYIFTKQILKTPCVYFQTYFYTKINMLIPFFHTIFEVLLCITGKYFSPHCPTLSAFSGFQMRLKQSMLSRLN